MPNPTVKHRDPSEVANDLSQHINGTVNAIARHDHQDTSGGRFYRCNLNHLQQTLCDARRIVELFITQRKPAVQAIESRPPDPPSTTEDIDIVEKIEALQQGGVKLNHEKLLSLVKKLRDAERRFCRTHDEFDNEDRRQARKEVDEFLEGYF